MLTKITPIEELKEIFVESVLNHTSEVTLITDGSVLNGISFGVAKLGQKTLKDIAVIEAHLFADSAYGVQLDNYAQLNGISPRLTQAQSSCYILLKGTAGTVYTAGVHTFKGNNGTIFDLENNTTIPVFGYTYAKIRSQISGIETNVDALSINIVTPIPVGHDYCINEYAATGGRDDEDDETFRQRIKDEINSLARHTISYLEQIFIKINSNVLRVFNYGFNQNNEVILAIATVNGVDLTAPELDDLLIRGEQYFSLAEMRPNNGINNVGVELRNIDWYPIDISFRVDIDGSYNVDTVRKNIQIGFNKELDYRFWDWTKRVEWDNLLQIVKNTDGVRYVLDSYFFPQADITIPTNKLPRIRGFQMLDLNGGIIVNLAGTLNPIYFPNQADFSFQASVLASIS